MTDTTSNAIPDSRPARHSTERQANVRKRFKAETRFKYLGLGSVLLAVAFLALLLSTVIGNGLPAFRINTLSLPVDLSASKVDPEDPSSAKYRSLINDGIQKQLPFISDRRNKKLMRGLVSSGASSIAKELVVGTPSLLGKVSDISIPLSDTADLYFKGLLAEVSRTKIDDPIKLSGVEKSIDVSTDKPIFAPFISDARILLGENAARLRSRSTSVQRSIDKLSSDLETAKSVVANESSSDEAKARAERSLNDIPGKIDGLKADQQLLAATATQLETRSQSTSGNEKLTSNDPSLLLEVNGGILKITEAGSNTAKAQVLVPPSALSASDGWRISVIETPESERKISDKEIAWLEHLNSAGRVENGWNTIFFTRGASREAEMAGIWGAVIGSLLTMLVTLALSFPLGVAAAIYLEEFAPKNKLTDFIEVNINNLAAVPSIVFGLLGLGIFINGVSLGWFTLGGGFPRSAAITGGTVLALMTLPTIIIASRAALRAVPPSIREAAMGIGASKVQTVFHHVLPLAMPGMLTGTIIGMAQALGETAPLLMIGMVAFIVDIPGGFTDPATVLPVQIYMWADFPEIAFQQKTAAAIMILLGFLVLMNAIAVLLRKKFERRW